MSVRQLISSTRHYIFLGDILGQDVALLTCEYIFSPVYSGKNPLQIQGLVNCDLKEGTWREQTYRDIPLYSPPVFDEEGNYHDGVREGSWSENNGMETATGNYKAGRPVGPWEYTCKRRISRRYYTKFFPNIYQLVLLTVLFAVITVYVVEVPYQPSITVTGVILLLVILGAIVGFISIRPLSYTTLEAIICCIGLPLTLPCCLGFFLSHCRAFRREPVPEDTPLFIRIDTCN